jgi:hypothetical protein
MNQNHIKKPFSPFKKSFIPKLAGEIPQIIIKVKTMTGTIKFINEPDQIERKRTLLIQNSEGRQVKAVRLPVFIMGEL